MTGKYQPYPVYKDSGIKAMDCIPTHWTTISLKHILSMPITDGPHETPTFYDEGIPFVSAEAISKGFIDFTKIRGFISEEDDQRFRKKYYPKKHDVYMVKSGATTGYTAIVETNKHFNIWSPIAVMRCGEKYKPYFLLNFLRSLNFQTLLELSWTFGTQQNIGMGTLENLPVCLPSIEEQSQIANFLDHETAKIDTLIAKQEKLIELLQEKRQAVISHAVTKGLDPDVPMKDSGVEWLGEVPVHWEVTKLIHRTSKIGDGLHSTPKYQENTGFFFVNGNNLIDGKITIRSTAKEVPKEEYEKHYIYLSPNSVLMSINGTIGNVALYNNENIILGKSAAYMDCSQPLLAEFLLYFLQSNQANHYFELEVTGTTIFNLSLQSIRQMKVCIPCKKEQILISKYCYGQKKKYDDLIEKSQYFISLFKERRTALISAAVTGKIDVRNWEPNETQDA